MSAEEGRDWPRELRAGGPTTDAALADLRGVLLRGLRRALSGRAGADDALIEDLAQEATLRVLGRLDGYRGESRFTTWAVTGAVRVALTELRGMPQEEIARQLGIGRNALYKLGHDARKRLKARLAAAGVTDEDVRSAFDL